MSTLIAPNPDTCCDLFSSRQICVVSNETATVFCVKKTILSGPLLGSFSGAWHEVLSEQAYLAQQR